MQNQREVDGLMREKIEASSRKGCTGVGPAHSSDEALEAPAKARRGGAKGPAEQGTRDRDR